MWLYLLGVATPIVAFVAWATWGFIRGNKRM